MTQHPSFLGNDTGTGSTDNHNKWRIRPASHPPTDLPRRVHKSTKAGNELMMPHQVATTVAEAPVNLDSEISDLNQPQISL